MGTVRVSDKPKVHTLSDGDTAVVVLDDGKNRRIGVPLLRRIMSCPPIDLTPEAGAPTIFSGTFTRASDQTPEPEHLRGMIAALTDGSDVTVDTLYSDADFEDKKAAAFARGETFWYIRVFSSIGYPEYWCLESAVERGYGQRDWFYLFPTAGTYYLPPYISGTTEVTAAGIYAREELLGGALLLDRIASTVPHVTEADNGKIAQVVDGAWAAVKMTDVSQVGM